MSKRLFTCALCSADVWLEEPPAGVILCERCRARGVSRRAFLFFAAAAVVAPALPAIPAPAPKKLYDLSGLTFHGVPLVVSPDVPRGVIVLAKPPLGNVVALCEWLDRTGTIAITGGVEGDPPALIRAARAPIRPSRT